MTRTEERFGELLRKEGELLELLIDVAGTGHEGGFDQLLEELKQNDQRRVHVLRQLDVEIAIAWEVECRG